MDETFPERRVLLLGGARSGKSALAERLATASGLRRVYVATAEAWDDEMRARIARHRADRGTGWRTVEAPMALADAIRAHDDHESVIVVDCLTLWLTNVMLAGRDADAEVANLESATVDSIARLIFVTNEVGQGIVPDNALARRFRDAQGRLNQRMAARCERVVLVAAGLPLVLKP